jgi:hypothetical protein
VFTVSQVSSAYDPARYFAEQALLPYRQCVLAVSVLSDLDVIPADTGVQLPGPNGVLIDWATIREACGPYPPDGPIARSRVEVLLKLHRLATELGQEARQRFESASRLIALPYSHTEHPGPGWVIESLRGGALDLGIGVHGLIEDADRAVPVPPSVLHAVGVVAEDWWPRLREHANRMGALSASRLARDGSTGLIRPVGGCDVLALLSSPALRRHLATSDGTGMRALAVPTRQRGWFDISRIDPVFVQAAWSLTDEADRGVPVPLLVTEDDVVLPAIP